MYQDTVHLSDVALLKYKMTPNIYDLISHISLVLFV